MIDVLNSLIPALSKVLQTPVCAGITSWHIVRYCITAQVAAQIAGPARLGAAVNVPLGARHGTAQSAYARPASLESSGCTPGVTGVSA